MQSPHDTLFHLVMRHPAHAAAWVRSILPAILVPAVDWRTFVVAGERVPGLRLRSQRLDLVFVADLCSGGARLVVLIEHKSAPDAALLAQLLRYCVHLLHSMRRVGGPPCHVAPLVLSHGGAPILARPASGLEPDLANALVPLQPRLDPLLDDLDVRPESDLLHASLPPAVRLLFLCLQQARHHDAAGLLQAIDRWADLLRAVESDPCLADPYDLLDAVGWYLVDTSELTETQVQMAFDRHPDHPENQRITTGQRIRMESRALGRTEGKAEGKAEAKAEILIRLVQRRFGPLALDRRDRILAAPVEQLDRWTDRLLDAASCDDVFVEG